MICFCRASTSSRPRSGSSREILLVPAPGRYTVRSGNLLYRLMGMSAEIVVE
jgi:hypothetical protein